jgi:tetratricopeptide (TPR) repeat protein
VRQPLLLQYYQLLPASSGAADLPPNRKGLGRFKRSVQARYNEATLERLLEAHAVDVRQAAIQALALMFRGGEPEHNDELQRLIRIRTGTQQKAEELEAAFTALIRKAPRFAEAYNQRAIFHFRQGNYVKAIADCEKALRLNPHHFGAASGLGQCFLRQKKLRAALRVYRRAARLNPNLDGVREAIVSLERTLGEEGKR